MKEELKEELKKLWWIPVGGLAGLAILGYLWLNPPPTWVVLTPNAICWVVEEGEWGPAPCPATTTAAAETVTVAIVREGGLKYGNPGLTDIFGPVSREEAAASQEVGGWRVKSGTAEAVLVVFGGAAPGPAWVRLSDVDLRTSSAREEAGTVTGVSWGGDLDFRDPQTLEADLKTGGCLVSVKSGDSTFWAPAPMVRPADEEAAGKIGNVADLCRAARERRLNDAQTAATARMVCFSVLALVGGGLLGFVGVKLRGRFGGVSITAVLFVLWTALAVAVAVAVWWLGGYINLPTAAAAVFAAALWVVGVVVWWLWGRRVVVHRGEELIIQDRNGLSYEAIQEGQKTAIPSGWRLMGLVEVESQTKSFAFTVKSGDGYNLEVTVLVIFKVVPSLLDESYRHKAMDLIRNNTPFRVIQGETHEVMARFFAATACFPVGEQTLSDGEFARQRVAEITLAHLRGDTEDGKGLDLKGRFAGQVDILRVLEIKVEPLVGQLRLERLKVAEEQLLAERRRQTAKIEAEIDETRLQGLYRGVGGDPDAMAAALGSHRSDTRVRVVGLGQIFRQQATPGESASEE